MFHLCNLESLDVLNFNTEKVIFMKNMFSYCGILTSLNLSSFNTKEVTDFSCMFKGNHYLKNIDISHFYTDKMNIVNDMFQDLPENGTITINLQYTSALILNQIPDEWIKIKFLDNNH